MINLLNFLLLTLKACKDLKIKIILVITMFITYKVKKLLKNTKEAYNIIYLTFNDQFT